MNINKTLIPNATVLPPLPLRDRPGHGVNKLNETVRRGMYTHFQSSRSGRGQGSPLQRPQRGPPPLPAAAAAGAYGLRRATARSGRGCDGACVRRAPAPRPRPGHSCRAVLQSRRRPGVRLGGPSLGSWAASAGPPGMGLPRPSATLGESPPAPVRAQPSGGSWRGRLPRASAPAQEPGSARRQPDAARCGAWAPSRSHVLHRPRRCLVGTRPRPGSPSKRSRGRRGSPA